MRPVKQNWQFMAQPSWLLTQMVMRSFCPWRREMGMSTASTVPPAAGPRSTSKVSFLVPSDAACTLSSRRPASTVATASTLSRNARPKL